MTSDPINNIYWMDGWMDEWISSDMCGFFGLLSFYDVSRKKTKESNFVDLQEKKQRT
jgi:hypothetical protein